MLNYRSPTQRVNRYWDSNFLPAFTLCIYIVIYCLMVMLLVSREIPIGEAHIDDAQYLENFATGLTQSEFESPLALLEEPLWRAYCEIVSTFLSPTDGMRLTILLLTSTLGLVPVLLRARGLMFF